MTYSSPFAVVPVRFFVLCLLGALCCAAVGCTQSVQKVSQASLKAEALDDLSIRDTPAKMQEKSPEELLAAGYFYLDRGNAALARLHFTTALEKQSDFAPAYIGLGRMAMQAGQPDVALNMFRRADQIDPTLLPALTGQAQALRTKGQLNAAIEMINRAMALAPDNIAVYRELAMIYDMMGRENLAEPLYREVVSRAPDVAANHNNLGMNKMVLGDHAAAVNAFLQALELAPDNRRIKNNLATAYALKGEPEKALKIFTATLGEAAAYNNLGYLYLTQGRYALAEDYLQRALAANPKYYQRAQDNLEKLERLRRAAVD